MGAAAFLMAEMTGIPYLTIAISAIVPALLYFTGIFFAVHFEARKLGLKGLPKETLPHFGRLALAKGYLLLPIFVLVGFMGQGFTPAYAACFAILSVVAVSMFRKETRFSPAGLLNALVSGARNTIGVAIACALAGTIIGIVSLTGLGQTLVGALITIVNTPFFASTGTSLLVALVLTMLACLVFGMGVPTTANYVIMATITAPMVLRTGVELGIAVPVLAAHMFVFYFGIVADITPPVALAAYAGAAIAKSDPIKTAITATRLAIAAFIVPFVFIFNPAMLLIDASLPTIIQTFVTTSIGMLGVAMGLAGYINTKLSAPWRIIAIAGGLCLIHPSLLTDKVGSVLVALVIAAQVIASKRQKPA
jgi:TRAP transporter 4TM/12TM fusion protein